MDHVLIVGSDMHELIEIVDTVLSRLEEAGFKLRSEKCEIMLEKVSFL